LHQIKGINYIKSKYNLSGTLTYGAQYDDGNYNLVNSQDVYGLDNINNRLCTVQRISAYLKNSGNSIKDQYIIVNCIQILKNLLEESHRSYDTIDTLTKYVTKVDPQYNSDDTYNSSLRPSEYLLNKYNIGNVFSWYFNLLASNNIEKAATNALAFFNKMPESPGDFAEFKNNDYENNFIVQESNLITIFVPVNLTKYGGIRVYFIVKQECLYEGYVKEFFDSFEDQSDNPHFSDSNKVHIINDDGTKEKIDDGAYLNIGDIIMCTLSINYTSTIGLDDNSGITTPGATETIAYITDSNSGIVTRTRIKITIPMINSENVFGLLQSQINSITNDIPKNFNIDINANANDVFNLFTDDDNTSTIIQTTPINYGKDTFNQSVKHTKSTTVMSALANKVLSKRVLDIDRVKPPIGLYELVRESTLSDIFLYDIDITAHGSFTTEDIVTNFGDHAYAPVKFKQPDNLAARESNHVGNFVWFDRIVYGRKPAGTDSLQYTDDQYGVLGFFGRIDGTKTEMNHGGNFDNKWVCISEIYKPFNQAILTNKDNSYYSINAIPERYFNPFRTIQRSIQSGHGLVKVDLVSAASSSTEYPGGSGIFTSNYICFEIQSGGLFDSSIARPGSHIVTTMYTPSNNWQSDDTKERNKIMLEFPVRGISGNGKYLITDVERNYLRRTPYGSSTSYFNYLCVSGNYTYPSTTNSIGHEYQPYFIKEVGYNLTDHASVIKNTTAWGVPIVGNPRISFDDKTKQVYHYSGNNVGWGKPILSYEKIFDLAGERIQDMCFQGIESRINISDMLFSYSDRINIRDGDYTSTLNAINNISNYDEHSMYNNSFAVKGYQIFTQYIYHNILSKYDPLLNILQYTFINYQNNYNELGSLNTHEFINDSKYITVQLYPAEYFLSVVDKQFYLHYGVGKNNHPNSQNFDRTPVLLYSGDILQQDEDEDIDIDTDTSIIIDTIITQNREKQNTKDELLFTKRTIQPTYNASFTIPDNTNNNRAVTLNNTTAIYGTDVDLTGLRIFLI
jgi:hypothetical protein